MGFYDRHVLPHLINWGCGQEAMTDLRRNVVPRAHGQVLEIGVGSGLNLAHYNPCLVESVTGIDPSLELLALAEPRAAAAAFPVRLRTDSAERIPLPAQSFDTVVVTFTLCSIPDIGSALAEMHRLLKPEGKLFFSEHGRSPDAAVGRWQERINPLWNRVAGGCNLNRDIATAIADARFHIEEIDTGYMPKAPLKIAGYHYTGVAVPR